jgi:hypothetical protein
MRILAFVVGIGCACVLACSSGSSSNGAEDAASDGTGTTAGCSTPPCGGDVVGTWTLETFCAPPGITAPTDTITFNADGTYSISGGSGGSGNWSTSGNDLTTGGVTGSYCVEGDTLVSSYGISKGTLTKVRTRMK